MSDAETTVSPREFVAYILSVVVGFACAGAVVGSLEIIQAVTP